MVAGKSAEGGAHRRRRRQRRHGGDVAGLDLLRRRWLDEEARECEGGGLVKFYKFLRSPSILNKF
jgi:hypothetical protein